MRTFITLTCTKLNSTKLPSQARYFKRPLFKQHVDEYYIYIRIYTYTDILYIYIFIHTHMQLLKQNMLAFGGPPYFSQKFYPYSETALPAFFSKPRHPKGRSRKFKEPPIRSIPRRKHVPQHPGPVWKTPFWKVFTGWLPSQENYIQ